MFSLYISSLLLNVHNWLSYSFLEIYISLPAIIIVDKFNGRAAIRLGFATHSIVIIIIIIIVVVSSAVVLMHGFYENN